MGYLNNSTRILDAILTKKGREILSSGGDFEVSKFALGDDEIDYSLWDTSHADGTDYYGAVIDNLPALEPFNDPSEIMKYKLVTRTVGTRAMALLEIVGETAGGLLGLKYVDGATSDKVPIGTYDQITTSKVSGNGAATIAIKHKDNTDDFPQGTDYNEYFDENYTVTLLDASVAVMAPAFSNSADLGEHIPTLGTAASGMIGDDFLWVPFIDNVQHISQTVSGVSKVSGGQLTFNADGTQAVSIYTKQIAATTKTSIVITGEKSGAVIEFLITIELS